MVQQQQLRFLRQRQSCSCSSDHGNFGIVECVPIQIGIATIETTRVFRGPPAGLEIIISGSKSDQFGVAVVEPPGKSEGLEAGVGIERDITKLIIVQPLRNGTVGGVDNKPWATEVIANDAIRHTALDEVCQHIGFIGIDKAGDDIVVAIELGDGAELVLIQEARD